MKLENFIFPTLGEAAKAAIRTNDLMVIRNPYVVLGLVVMFIFIIILITKMPEKGHSKTIHPWESFKKLLANKLYCHGVIAQVFYVATQIMCWTFIIQYADNLNIDKATAQKYNMVAMAMFLSSRFISTYLMKFINARKLLQYFAMAGMVNHHWHHIY